MGRLPTGRRAHSRRARRHVVESAVAVAAAVTVMTAVPQAGAAFRATTAGSDALMATGTVAISDDDSGTAMFAPATLTPSSPAVECIAVNYTGTASAAVKLYATLGGTSSVYPYVTLTVEQGTGGSSNACTGFSATSTLFSGTLDTWTATSYAAGLGSWSPASAAGVTYRFTATIASGTPTNQAGLSATVVPTWEARAGT